MTDRGGREERRERVRKRWIERGKKEEDEQGSEGVRK